VVPITRNRLQRVRKKYAFATHKKLFHFLGAYMIS
jgi:hypothetical protein